MKVRVQTVLVISGILALFLPFFFMAGWLKYLIMFLGALALHAVWDLYAGTPVVEKEHSQSLTFSEDDYKVGENDCSHWADIGIGMGVGRDD
ncbi:hypothetical protein [Chromobacterium violaceum]|uniref:hypothetical protein n=1 Tax=Chromobacterium violaceum TaxID=536 RepID=UPI0005DEC530|nr:hypothetical protein [Chromobacterium violaceum]KJH67496.1 hypothetical protein UF16_10520 [Chromobacterium violaceum]